MVEGPHIIINMPSAFQLIPTIALGLFWLALASCRSSPSPSADAVLGLQPQLTIGEVRDRSDITLQHQASALINDRTIVLVTADFDDPFMRLLLVFEDDHLSRMFDFTLWGAGYGLPWPSDNEKRLRSALASPSLTQTELSQLLAERRAEEAYGEQFLKPGPVLLAAMITAPLQILTLPREFAQHRRENQLAAHYDPLRISIGMTAAEVDGQLGEPRNVVVDDGGRHVRIYGEPAIDQHPRSDASWIAVGFEDGRAVRVFSNSFFDDRWRPFEGRRTYAE